MRQLFNPGLAVMSLSALVWALGGPTTVYAGHHGGHGSSGGSYGSHGSSGGYYSHGSHGSSGGYYSHGSHGSHGSSGGYYSHGSHGSSGGHYSHGSHGSSGGNHHNGNGDGYQNGEAPPPAEAYRSRLNNRVARLTVNVPEDAKVYLQDQPMTLTGKVRQFVSPRLNPEKEYEYTIRVELEKDGQLISQTTKARVRAGKRVQVSVDFAADDPTQLVASVQ